MTVFSQTATSFFLLFSLMIPVLVSAQAMGLQRGQVAYVMEPFEWLNASEWILEPRDLLNVTLVDEQEALFGAAALRVQVETNLVKEAEVGLVQVRTPHSCYGASHLSLWYKLLIQDSSHSVTQLRLMLLDDSGDSDLNGASMEVYYATHPLVPNQDWQELTVPWEELQLASTSTAVGNGQLDLHRLRGWKLELITSAGSTTSTSNGTTATTTLLLDQLSCVGGQDLIAAAFHPGDSWEQALQDLVWDAEWYQSEWAKNQSQVLFKNDQNGTLVLDYAVQMTESWGGFNSLDFLPPGPAYYNLSQVNHLQLGYQVRHAASPPGRTHLRLLLADSSNVCGNCSHLEDWEWWYAFAYVLDDLDGTIGQITMPLIGSATNNSMPFWLPGWAGGVGNRQFDPAYIKGFNLQLSMDSIGEIGSNITGAIDLFDFKAYYQENESNSAVAANTQQAVLETDLLFYDSPRFQPQEFLHGQCEETCAADPACLYGFVRGYTCYTASYLEPQDVGIPNTLALQEAVTSFWMDDPIKRGNFCEQCQCQEADRSIDCQSKDLVILPKTFDLPWKPRSLDLRNNPRLILLGRGSLDAIAESLEEVWLPHELQHASQDGLDNLPMLSALHSDSDGTSLQVANVIADGNEAFGDVCCSIGHHLDLGSPAAGISFCDMKVKHPGVDSTYIPFTKFDDASTWAEVRPSSIFMAEAAESPQKCAEYCSISKECNFWSYDGRIENAEHICYLLEDMGSGPLEVCCEEDHYADEEQTLPGWTSGLPPRTRHTAKDARVLIEPHTIAVDTSFAGLGEAYFDLKLGSKPLRGAVWIEPEIALSTDVKVSFDPPRVVLYDETTSARVNVRIAADGPISAGNLTSIAFVIQNHIISCDTAFMEFEDDSMVTRETTVFVDVTIPQLEEIDQALHPAVTAAIVVGVIVSVGLLFHLWMEHKRRQLDAIWIIKREEIVFPDQPVVLGRGSFGLVLKAEYRGSEVAVKRALPEMKLKSSQTRQGNMSGSGRFMASESGTSSASSAAKIQCAFGKASGSGMYGMRSNGPSVDRSSWSKMKKHFMAEMRQLSSLRHPCITTTMGAVVGREPMLVLELMDHGSLYDLLHNETWRLDPEMVLPILLDISQGMRFLHSAKVIHGDIKAANILVDKKFRAKISDFGMAGRRAGSITGTPFWAAPELLDGSSSNTTASDVYSFGVLLFELYSRKDPYEEDLEKMGTDEILALIADETVSKRPPTPRNMPAPVASVMIECFVHDSEERPNFEEIDKRLKRVDLKSLQLDGSGRNRSTRNVSLFDIFPKKVAEALASGEEVEATHKDCCTIFFSDIVGFTDISAELEPKKVAVLLDRLYTKFDALSHKHQIYKVETIGDAYMAVANLVEDQESDHVKRIAEFSVDAIAAARTVPIDTDDLEKGCVNIRVGFHSGAVVADVVGTRNPRYCLFGDAVNTASRMESSGEQGRIHCSRAAATLLEQQCPSMPINSRGTIEIKGKGRMHTYWCNEEGSKPSHVHSSNGSGHARNDELGDLEFYSTHATNFLGKGSGRWRNEPSQQFSEASLAESGFSRNEFAN